MNANKITDYYKYANVQMAAECLYGRTNEEWTIDGRRTNPTESDLSTWLQRGNDRVSAFPKTLADEFTKCWTVVEHRANTATGFSGTLFKAKSADALGEASLALGIKPNEYVLSFRSTEFADDAVRDNQATNVLEVEEFGFAVGQIAEGGWRAEAKSVRK
jgi:hypothetical protein